MLQPRAAAGAAAGAGGEAQPPGPEPVQQAPKTKARPLSMIQRWRAFKFAVKEWAERMRCGWVGRSGGAAGLGREVLFPSPSALSMCTCAQLT